jgi:hypothetical protein
LGLYLKILPLKLEISMKILFLIFLCVLFSTPTFAQSLANPAIGRSANPYSLATKQYLAGKGEESLALYQKAITKSEMEYGKNARAVGALYYELGVRAFWLSKFNLAERSLKKAVEINPNCEAAQLMLINLLRFRNRDAEALGHIQQALKKHPDSTPLRKDLIIALQERDPSKATVQAFTVNCIQNGITEKIPTISSETSPEPKKVAEQDANGKTKKNNLNKQNTAVVKRPNLPKNDLKQKGDLKQTNQLKVGSKAIYEPVSPNTPPKITKVKSSKPRKHSSNSQMPAGLVPPPPPDTFGFLGQHPAGMKAKAGSIKSQNAQSAPEQAEAPTKHAVERPSSTESDPDFLIEWASVKKKHPITK